MHQQHIVNMNRIIRNHNCIVRAHSIRRHISIYICFTCGNTIFMPGRSEILRACTFLAARESVQRVKKTQRKYFPKCIMQPSHLLSIAEWKQLNSAFPSSSSSSSNGKTLQYQLHKSRITIFNCIINEERFFPNPSSSPPSATSPIFMESFHSSLCGWLDLSP